MRVELSPGRPAVGFTCTKGKDVPQAFFIIMMKSFFLSTAFQSSNIILILSLYVQTSMLSYVIHHLKAWRYFYPNHRFTSRVMSA